MENDYLKEVISKVNYKWLESLFTLQKDEALEMAKSIQKEFIEDYSYTK